MYMCKLTIMEQKSDLKKLIEISQALGLVQDYDDFCMTPEADEYALDEEEKEYYRELCEKYKNNITK